MLAEPVTDLEYDVPAEAEPETCPHCGRPFQTAEQVTYHVGVVHDDTCSEGELEAFEAAREDESFELFTFHVKAAVTVFMVYFMFSFMYALVWAG
ncbi:DUF7410 domain-containing protein [Natronosalvus vescus]|uniref:DUF7410 domain-containing protein n=1 Tax=Natronosalvus vescus TaxID=2953881 RepID=UPI00209164CE|nr:hypothetical protein [Natronosalvus vescus]